MQQDTTHDLEQKIFSCWSIVDELDVVCKAVEDGDTDEILNMLIGLKAIYSRKFQALFDSYEGSLNVNAPPKKSVEPFGF
jgi:hypothetical protein